MNTSNFGENICELPTCMNKAFACLHEEHFRQTSNYRPFHFLKLTTKSNIFITFSWSIVYVHTQCFLVNKKNDCEIMSTGNDIFYIFSLYNFNPLFLHKVINKKFVQNKVIIKQLPYWNFYIIFIHCKQRRFIIFVISSFGHYRRYRR